MSRRVSRGAAGGGAEAQGAAEVEAGAETGSDAQAHVAPGTGRTAAHFLFLASFLSIHRGCVQAPGLTHRMFRLLHNGGPGVYDRRDRVRARRDPEPVSPPASRTAHRKPRE
ncbi:2-keto-4-pentenoate hydratase [Burkholderia diffusa]|nr:2-keto-4-pentenoate hydratase [Burkholderia diffusa]